MKITRNITIAEQFQAGDYVYLYSPARKPGLSRKFHKAWTSPFIITAKISDLNYETLGHNDRKLVVHVNGLKVLHGHDALEPKPRTRRKSRPRKDSVISHSSDELAGVQLGTRPLLKEVPQEHDTAPNPPLWPSDSSSPTHHMIDTPTFQRYDPSYLPENTPRSRREIQPTRDEPPLTRVRTRLNAQEPADI